MRNWTVCSGFLTPFLSLFFLIFGLSQGVHSQSLESQKSYKSSAPLQIYQHRISNYHLNDFQTDTTSQDPNGGFPDPKKVMFQSLMIPGWGQITNHQIWKVPIVYGLLGGLTWYSINLTKSYHRYRAAYYNLNPDTPDDFRFGPTPPFISENANLQQLKTQRNSFRNQRDMVYIYLALAYGLNILDAFVFAHMRSFDVSKDLSMRTRIQPNISDKASPMITLSIALIKK